MIGLLINYFLQLDNSATSLEQINLLAKRSIRLPFLRNCLFFAFNLELSAFVSIYLGFPKRLSELVTFGIL